MYQRQRLSFYNTKVRDLRVLAGMPLSHLKVNAACKDLEFLRKMKSLNYLSNNASYTRVKKFWKEWDAKKKAKK